MKNWSALGCCTLFISVEGELLRIFWHDSLVLVIFYMMTLCCIWIAIINYNHYEYACVLLNPEREAEGRAHLVSWNCLGLRAVCVSAPVGINNQWRFMVLYRPCAIDQTSFMAFPAFIYFIWHLVSIEWMGVAILTQHVVNAWSEETNVKQY